MSDRSLIQNPFGDTQSPIIGGGLVSVEQQRAIAEVQARMIIARANPRDPIRCMDMILRDCTRQSLAECALYQFARGGSSISGPSIRLMEAIAQRWGNVASGIKEISRQSGSSECVAYAWDLETGYYDERQFQVRHWRDTRGGGHLLKDERDIYELIANMGQRRKRAVLQAVIPGEVVEAAAAQCEQTLRSSADASPEAIKKMIEAFGQFDVSKEQIETRCQCHAEAIRPAQLVQLRKIFASLKDGMSFATDWFPDAAPPARKAANNGNGQAPLDRFEQQHGEPEDKPNRFYRQKETEAEVTAREVAAEDEELPEYEPEPRQETVIETGGHARWIDNFNALEPRADLSGAADWRTYAEGAAYLISQASKNDLSGLEVSKHPHLKRLREEDSDLYRSLTATLASRARELAAGASKAA